MARTFLGIVFVLGLALAAGACGGEELTGSPDAAGSGGNDCGPDNCAGCCTQEGACITNIWDRQCGTGGDPCTDCSASGDACDDEVGACRAPPACDESNCPDGCCDGDECIEPGDQADACGTGGTQCQVCDVDSGHRCDGSQCRATCGPDTCSGCCVDEFTCRDDPNERACGGEGEPCEDCGVDGVCSSGECVDATCANTCDGCCTEDGDCIDAGDNIDDAQCGRRGELCAECGDDRFCAEPGRCISETCTDSCQGGCCDDDGTCHSGGSAAACGGGAQACINCVQESLWGENSICSGDAECRLDPNSRWDVIIESAEVPLHNQDGDHWDPLARAPDPYVVLTVGLGTGDERTGQTPHVSNTTSADYDSYVVLESVRAEQLIGEGQRQFVVMDYDPWPISDDQMSLEVASEVSEDLFTGGIIAYTQRDHYEDAVNTPLEFVIRYRLVPSESSSPTLTVASEDDAENMCAKGGRELLEGFAER